MKKIILGTLVLLTIGMGFGFAETQKETDDYYRGYTAAARDYSNKNQKYNPNSCYNANKKKETFDCIRGYQDSWERSSEVAPRTPKENSSLAENGNADSSEVAPRTPKDNSNNQ